MQSIPTTFDVVTTFELTKEEDFKDGKRLTYAAKNVADERTPLTMTVNVATEAVESETPLDSLLIDMAATELVPFAVAHIMATEEKQ